MAEPRSLRRQRKQTREKVRSGWGRFWLAVAIVLFYPISALLARTKVTGLDRLPAEGPVLLVLNHVSHLDPVYDAVTVHRAGRLPRFLAKNTLWNVPVLRSVLVNVEQIPVFRGTADASKSLEQAHKALREDKVILIYPDGTITKDPDGWPMMPKPGVARLALENDIPVVPVARWGTRDVYDHYKKKFRPFPRKQVTYKFGEPIDLSVYRDKEIDNHLLREVTDLTMRRVRELLGEVREQQPPEEFYSPARRSQNDA